MKALSLVLFVLTLSLSAVARPGGGQSFRSSSPSYDSSSSSGSSYSGSSSGSSGSSWWSSSGSSSSSSSGSAWWSSSRSSSSSSDTGSSYEPSTPSYQPSYEVEAAQTRADCYRSCMGQTAENMSNCFHECDTPKLTARDPRNRSYKRSGDVPQVAPPPDPPIALHFWIPGLLLGVVSVSAAVSHWMRKRDERFWAAMSGDVDDELARHQAFMARQMVAQRRHPSIRAALRELQSKDDAFSFVLLEDFLHALYVEAHTLRGKGKLALLRPYFRQEALASLAALPQLPVTAVIVGSTETLEIASAAAERELRVQVAFEANYTEGAQSYAVREVWTLARGADIVSRPPKRARVIGCANCGAPLDKLVGDTCEHCGAPSAPGSRDWQVISVAIEARESRPPQLSGTTEEQGTNLPTLTAPDLKGEFGALAVRDPEFSWAAFVARVEHVFHTFHEAWVAQELAPVRPYFSDQLFEAQRYWVGAYQAQELRNVTEDRQLVTIALSRVLHDKYYDAITVRVFAQCKDFTLDDRGNVVGGSRDTIRRYSEYWTFVRSVEKRGAAKKDPGCPNCGAPIAQINMAGDCASCQAHVTTGEFDWVLSRIEQDEVYRL